MHAGNEGEPDQVCGVDRTLVESFLVLIRDKYQAAERAIFFLEEHAGTLSTTALSNLRDVFSHLCTLLDENTPKDKRVVQLASAEEHLRRAIIDPYKVAYGRLRQNYKKLLEEYRIKVLPIRTKGGKFKDAPSEESIRLRYKEILHLAKEGRAANGRNLWDERWDEGINGYVEAYDRLSLLSDQLTGYCNLVQELKRERAQRVSDLVGVASLVVTLAALAFSVWVVVDPAVGKSIRRFVGLDN